MKDLKLWPQNKRFQESNGLPASKECNRIDPKVLQAYPLIQQVCCRYLKGDEASTMAIQILEKINRKIRTNQVAYFSSWVAVLSKNECLSHLRRKRIEPKYCGLSHPAFDQKERQYYPADVMEKLELSEAQNILLHAALAKLKEPQRQCIKLFFFEKESYKSIATKTGFPLKSVKSYIQNGKRNLKKQLLSVQKQTFWLSQE